MSNKESVTDHSLLITDVISPSWQLGLIVSR